MATEMGLVVVPGGRPSNCTLRSSPLPIPRRWGLLTCSFSTGADLQLGPFIDLQLWRVWATNNLCSRMGTLRVPRTENSKGDPQKCCGTRSCEKFFWAYISLNAEVVDKYIYIRVYTYILQRESRTKTFEGCLGNHNRGKREKGPGKCPHLRRSNKIVCKQNPNERERVVDDFPAPKVGEIQ